jgi:hypothetical protein
VKARSALVFTLIVFRTGVFVVSNTLVTIVLLRHRFEGGQCLGPKPIEIVPEGIDARRIQFVDPAIAGGPIDDEAGVLQDPQMLGDGRTADREVAGELAHRLRAVQQAFEDRAARRITERVELLRMLVSNH